MMTTLCEVAGTELPPNYPGDGSSIVPILQDNASARKKEWICIWYRGQVMVRDKQYTLLAKTDCSDARLTRYARPFDGEEHKDSALSVTGASHQGSVRGLLSATRQDTPCQRE